MTAASFALSPVVNTLLDVLGDSSIIHAHQKCTRMYDGFRTSTTGLLHVVAFACKWKNFSNCNNDAIIEKVSMAPPTSSPVMKRFSNSLERPKSISDFHRLLEKNFRRVTVVGVWFIFYHTLRFQLRNIYTTSVMTEGLLLKRCKTISLSDGNATVLTQV